MTEAEPAMRFETAALDFRQDGEYFQQPGQSVKTAGSTKTGTERKIIGEQG